MNTTEAERAATITAMIEANPKYRAACAALDTAHRNYQLFFSAVSRAELKAANAAYDLAVADILAEAIAEYDSRSASLS